MLRMTVACYMSCGKYLPYWVLLSW